MVGACGLLGGFCGLGSTGLASAGEVWDSGFRLQEVSEA